LERVRPGAKVEPTNEPIGTKKAMRKGGPSKILRMVEVSLPISREVEDHEEFTGRTDAIASVEVRARVTGYLDKLNFKDGSDVKQGDVLFEIDPRPYLADLEGAKANLLQAQAHLQRLNTDFTRALGLLQRKAISQEEFDRIAGDHSEAEAEVGMAKASYDLAGLNLQFTKVIAPISGRISRRLIDPGNMVRADDTILTTIVTLDPMYIYFDVDEGTMLRLRRLRLAGKIRSARESEVSVRFRLADEQGFPHTSAINFADNKVDPSTGTLQVRAIFDNHERLLAPGLFAQVQLPVGDPHKAILVNERALMTDVGRKFLYVVHDNDQVEKREVTVGLAENGLRVIEKGLALNERVIVNGLQAVREGDTVTTQKVDMITAESTRLAAERDDPGRQPGGGE
jgi:RND family efflux transporter MFP subunit